MKYNDYKKIDDNEKKYPTKHIGAFKSKGKVTFLNFKLNSMNISTNDVLVAIDGKRVEDVTVINGVIRISYIHQDKVTFLETLFGKKHNLEVFKYDGEASINLGNLGKNKSKDFMKNYAQKCNVVSLDVNNKTKELFKSIKKLNNKW